MILDRRLSRTGEVISVGTSCQRGESSLDAILALEYHGNLSLWASLVFHFSPFRLPSYRNANSHQRLQAN